MEGNAQTVIQEVINKLQGLLSVGSSRCPNPKGAQIPLFDTALNKCIQISKSLSHEINQLTNIYLQASSIMKMVIGYSAVCKQYTHQQGEKIKQQFYQLAGQTQHIQKKGGEYVYHCRTIRELLSTAFWVFVDTPQIILKAAIEAADFNALKFQRSKHLDQNEWYKYLSMAIKQLLSYVMENYPMGLSYNSKGPDKWNDLIIGQPSAQTQPAKQEYTKKESSNMPLQTKKSKKRELVGQNFNISGYQNQVIQFSAGQLQMKHGIVIQNCTNIQINLDTKFKSITINKSDKVILHIRTCISGVQIMNSSGLTVFVKESIPSFAVHSSQNVKVVLNYKNLDCCIVSSKVAEFNVTYEKEDGREETDYAVSQQMITKWNTKNCKFQTRIYDKFA